MHFCKLYQSACSSSNFLVRTVFQSVSLSCCNFNGHNLMFGKSFVQDYSSISLDSVNLVRELRQLTFCTRLSDFRTELIRVLCVYIIVTRYILYSFLCGVNNNNNNHKQKDSHTKTQHLSSTVVTGSP